MRKKTSFGCNAFSRAIFTPKTKDDVYTFVQTMHQAGFLYTKDFHVLGKGSNLLIEDGGYTGCLIDLSKLHQIQTIEKKQNWIMDVQAGVGMGTLLQQLRKESYTGFEFTFGIPGSIGGGIRMNAGTPEGWFSQVLISVYGCTKEGEPFTKDVTENDFLYRDFPFGRDKIILGGTFVFALSEKQYIEEKIALAKSKRDLQPLQYPNFGSVFKNPKPYFAGALIEEVGLKGHQLGEAQISEKHANFIINHGLAKVENVKQLIELVQQKVYNHKGITLETEVHLIGKP
ncbi:MAG: UDP-N-acetylmuramate dehydrogenase [Bdellovibrionales bacterium]|nr:UDP-N-acetylmuramate dehydrogenase [Bdellovibrionales bacterium]